MRRRAGVLLAVLLGLLAVPVPASAAAPVTLSGRVLDETGRPVAGATVAGSVDIHYDLVESIIDDIGDALGCLFSFGRSCDTTDRVTATARTDRNGRYVLRYDTTWTLSSNAVHDVRITAPTLVHGTEPASTTMPVAYTTRRTLPTFRLWLRGAALDPPRGTRRRLRAGVPRVLGRPVRPPTVELVQGWATVWSYGQVGRDRDVDARVAEEGTTGVRSSVTTKVGPVSVKYRSGVRPVARPVRPLSRGKRCYDEDHGLPYEIKACPLTDGELAREAVSHSHENVVVDLGALSVPDAYIARGCAITKVATSVEGVVYRTVVTKEAERGVHTGRPDLPARYVRLTLDWCRPAELSVFGSPMTLPPGPPAPRPRATVTHRSVEESTVPARHCDDTSDRDVHHAPRRDGVQVLGPQPARGRTECPRRIPGGRVEDALPVREAR